MAGFGENSIRRGMWRRVRQASHGRLPGQVVKPCDHGRRQAAPALKRYRPMVRDGDRLLQGVFRFLIAPAHRSNIHRQTMGWIATFDSNDHTCQTASMHFQVTFLRFRHHGGQLLAGI